MNQNFRKILEFKDQFLALTISEKEQILSTLSEDELDHLPYLWPLWARPEQLLPEGDDWNIWLFMAGRSSGKTRSAAEAVKQLVCGTTPLSRGGYSRIGLIGVNEKSTRDVMVTGDAGLLSVHHKDFRPDYISSQAKLIWPNGAVATLYNDTAPENLRGPRFDAVWGDEIAAWRNLDETFTQIQMCCGLGPRPIQIYTTTPHTRKAKKLREIMNREKTIVSRSSSYANKANMTAAYFDTIREMYEGTRTGSQEIYGELIEDVEGALWNHDTILYSDQELTPRDIRDMNVRVVVGVDPSGTSKGDECGIVVAAATTNSPKIYYILEDSSFQGTPNAWASKVNSMYEKWMADKVIAEVNFGAEMVTEVLHNVAPELPVKSIHASKGKLLRAEPISSLYEQGKVYHGNRKMVKLETEMTEYDGSPSKKSPGRLDAMVWAMTELKSGYEYTSEQKKLIGNIKMGGLTW